MTGAEILLTTAAAALSACSLYYVGHLVRVSGRDRINDDAKVAQLIATAPRGRFDNVLTR